jgi:hypothetical protein
MRRFTRNIWPGILLAAAGWSSAQEYAPVQPMAPAEMPAVEAEEDAAPAPDPKAADAAKKKQADLKKAVANAYGGTFYNNNFKYLNDPAYNDWHLGEDFKQNNLGEWGTLDLGGQYRARLHDERNMRGFGLTGNDDDFLLHRTRLYANLQAGERIRFYAEYIDAESNYENFPPRQIEVNRSDMLNLFVDVRFLENLGSNDGTVTARLGRQELLYGAQRLVSPLDWANTRRTFEGVNVFYRGGDWSVDGFLTHPVIVDPKNFDSADYGQGFDGLYASYKGIENQTIDAYYLFYYNDNFPAPLSYNTMGGRWQGTKDQWMWEAEGAYQFGQNIDGSDHSAGFFVTGLGRNFEHDWKPSAWLYYDYSTGGNVLGGRQGFDHLFPLGHKYHGFMDLYGRSNIETPNVLVQAAPHEKLRVLLWYHYFFLENQNDTPYNINMTAFSPGSPPASRDLGHEIDLTTTYLITPRMDILFGYSHFFAGQYYKLTPGLPYRGDADFFYTQYQVNF